MLNGRSQPEISPTTTLPQQPPNSVMGQSTDDMSVAMCVVNHLSSMFEGHSVVWSCTYLNLIYVRMFEASMCVYVCVCHSVYTVSNINVLLVRKNG